MKEKDLFSDCYAVYCDKKATYHILDEEGNVISQCCKNHIELMKKYYIDIFDHEEKI